MITVFPTKQKRTAILASTSKGWRDGGGRARCGQRWAGGALVARLHFCVHAPASLAGNAVLGWSRAFWSPSV